MLLEQVSHFLELRDTNLYIFVPALLDKAKFLPILASILILVIM